MLTRLKRFWAGRLAVMTGTGAYKAAREGAGRVLRYVADVAGRVILWIWELVIIAIDRIMGDLDEDGKGHGK